MPTKQQQQQQNHRFSFIDREYYWVSERKDGKNRNVMEEWNVLNSRRIFTLPTYLVHGTFTAQTARIKVDNILKPVCNRNVAQCKCMRRRRERMRERAGENELKANENNDEWNNLTIQGKCQLIEKPLLVPFGFWST